MERIDDLNLNGKKIMQDTDLFLFGMDSVLLANMVKKTNKDTNILDLGTGSLVMPVIISEKVKCNKIIGVELQEKMYNLALKNIELNGLEGKVYAVKEDLKNVENIRKKIIDITGKEKVGKEETVYISNNNKFVIRERDILMFKLKKIHIIPIIMLLLFISGIVIHIMDLINISLDTIGESFKYIFLFKFMNLFLVFFVIICKSIKDKKKINKIKVLGTVVDVELRECSEPNEIAGHSTRRTYTMGTPKYEYTFNGKKQIYVSTTSSTGYPDIGETKDLYLDEEGLVIEEEGDIKFLIFFNFMLLVFYFIFFFSVFSELI